MPLAGESGVQGAESDEGVKAEQVGMSSDATTSDGASSTSTLLEEGYPKPCLLTNCILPGRPLFSTSVSLHDHMQVCIPSISKKRRSASATSSTDSPPNAAAVSAPVRQSTRVTSVPLRVCLDHEAAVPRSRGPVITSRRTTSHVSSVPGSPGAGSEAGLGDDIGVSIDLGGVHGSARVNDGGLQDGNAGGGGEGGDHVVHTTDPSVRRPYHSPSRGASPAGGGSLNGDRQGAVPGEATDTEGGDGAPLSISMRTFCVSSRDSPGPKPSWPGGRGDGSVDDGHVDGAGGNVTDSDSLSGYGGGRTGPEVDGGGVHSGVDISATVQAGGVVEGCKVQGSGELRTLCSVTDTCLTADTCAETGTVSSNMSIDSMSVTSSSAGTPDRAASLSIGAGDGDEVGDEDLGDGLDWRAAVQMEGVSYEDRDGAGGNNRSLVLSRGAGPTQGADSRLHVSLGTAATDRITRRRATMSSGSIAHPTVGMLVGRRGSRPSRRKSSRSSLQSLNINSIFIRSSAVSTVRRERTTRSPRSESSATAGEGRDGFDGEGFRRHSTRSVNSGSGSDGQEDAPASATEDDEATGRAKSGTAAGVKSWRGSLGTWGSSGAFTCPVNPCSTWDLIGCGRENRPRDTKCDHCNRIIRVDWHVGAASVGSGMENPQLKLASPVTFQNKNGLTYQGKVVAIDPSRTDEHPRGRVRVKYDDWPYDRYDEDCPMELVTPKGWTPTPLGRAGRRQIKPVNTFTPSSESYYSRRGSVSQSDAGGIPLNVEGGDEAGGSGDPWVGEGEAWDSPLKEDGFEDGELGEGDEHLEEDEEEGEESEEEPPTPKVVGCKHVLEEGAEIVSKTKGLCRICHKAALKARAGIKMCRHVRDGEARAYGRGPGDWGRGHCRECTLAKYPIKKVKVRKPRLWPTCSMPRCRKRHFAWGMCAACVSTFKEQHPEIEIPKQHIKSKCKANLKYFGEDAEFTDSSDDDAEASNVKETEAQEGASPGRGNGSKLREAPEVSRGKGDETCGSKRTGSMDGVRQLKRARRTQTSKDDPLCFYCQRTEGQDAKDILLECAGFECSRKVHMGCLSPPLAEVPERFYCPVCVAQGKDVVCERPCIVCNSDAHDDMMLVCDRECGTFFHTWCLPQPMDKPPDASEEYVCPICTGDDLERFRVVSKTSGGVRPARCLPTPRKEDAPPENHRRCGVCSKKCMLQVMWKCASGKAMCRGMVFHRRCLARGIERPDLTAPSTPTGVSTTRSSSPRVTRASYLPSLQWVGADGGRDRPSRASAYPCVQDDKQITSISRYEVLRDKDYDGARLCCPQCGYGWLEQDVVNVSREEEAYEGTPQQELAYRTFEDALRTCLEDPKYGIGKTRDAFEAPFKGSIGTGGNRTAM